jgi:flagellar motor component MotA
MDQTDQKDLKSHKRQGEQPAAQDELDILEMPVEALAAYWLSIKKLLDTKRDKTLLAAELENTSERFIRHLLDAAVSGLDQELIRRLSRAKAQGLLAESRRRFEMIRTALCGIAQGENPRLAFIRLSGIMGGAPVTEKRAFELAYGLMSTMGEKDADLPVLLCVDHKQKDDRLAVKLLFYALSARRNGKQTLNEYLPHLRPGYFTEGLSLAADGFEAEFVSRHLMALRDAALSQTRRKMHMATEMCLAIRAQLSYDDVFRVARAFMA